MYIVLLAGLVCAGCINPFAEALAPSLQASYNLTGTGLDPTNSTMRKRIQTALRKTLGSAVNATLLDVSGPGSSSADATSADATSADAVTPDATIAGATGQLLVPCAPDMFPHLDFHLLSCWIFSINHASNSSCTARVP